MIAAEKQIVGSVFVQAHIGAIAIIPPAHLVRACHPQEARESGIGAARLEVVCGQVAYDGRQGGDA